MTLDEYRKAMVALKKDFDKATGDLQRTAALSNNPVEKGMLVTDHLGSILVNAIGINWADYSSRLPTCIYSGVILTKQGAPRKDGKTRIVYQTNMVSYDKR